MSERIQVDIFADCTKSELEEFNDSRIWRLIKTELLRQLHMAIGDDESPGELESCSSWDDYLINSGVTKAIRGVLDIPLLIENCIIMRTETKT